MSARRRSRRASVALAACALAACRPGAPPPRAAAPPGPIVRSPLADLALVRLSGAWRWLHVARDAATLKVERERWQWDREEVDRATGQRQMQGRYRRDVLVVALDGESFLCNQLTSYVQTAVFTVRARQAARDEGGGVVIEELGYEVAPSPCEPGFRHLARYRADVTVDQATLTWDGGTQTLERLPAGALDAADVALTPSPATLGGRMTGAWHWRVVGHGGEREIREEDEAWQLAVGEDGTIGGTYRRVVTVHRPDGADIPCAGAPSYAYVDLYTLRGALDGDRAVVDEVAVEPGQHPCLVTTPTRHLDAFTATANGPYLELTWRGPRRQVLHRH